MTVLPAPRVETPTVAIPRQRGAHRRVAQPARLVEVRPVEQRRARVSPAVRGAGAAAFTLVARAGSLTTLAAMLVIGGTVATATDGNPPPTGAISAGLVSP